MLVIAGHITMDETKREEGIRAASKMMAATRQEAGCVSYTISADVDAPGRFHIFEEWESPEALDAHFAAPHMAEFQKAMGGFGIREMAVQRYEISSVGPIRP